MKGNRCVASRILVTSDEMAKTLPREVDSPYAAQVPATPVSHCVNSCCKTFVSKDDFHSFQDGVVKL
jgi:hypothetical protein